MPSKHSPRRGSLQYWPRVRAQREIARVRTWADIADNKPLGFLGFKAGMCQTLLIDNRPNAPTKGEQISVPTTIIECPSLKIAGANFYNNTPSGSKMTSTVFSQKLDNSLQELFPLPEDYDRSIEEVENFDEVRLLVHTQPERMNIGKKKPQISEVAIGGNGEQQKEYAKENLNKEISISELFDEGQFLDAHAVTKGKGFQGPVKRHGITVRQHKSEGSTRANIRGPWNGAKMWRVPHSGQMGYNQRTEINKKLLKIGDDPEQFTPEEGLHKYGELNNDYILVKGSIPGPKKRTVTLTQPMKPKDHPKQPPQIEDVIL